MLGLEGDESTWEERRTRGLEALFREIQTADSYLYQPSEGGLRQVAHLLEVDASMDGAVLVETHQEIVRRVTHPPAARRRCEAPSGGVRLFPRHP